MEHLPSSHEGQQLGNNQVPLPAESGGAVKLSGLIKEGKQMLQQCPSISVAAAFTCVYQGYQEAYEHQEDEPADAVSHGGRLLLRQQT